MTDQPKGDYYDDPSQVQAYIESRQSGLSRNELVEEPAFLALLAPVPLQDRACLDLGCGFGHYSSILAKRGGVVTATDRSALMLAAAHTSRPHERIHYEQVAMEDVTFPAATFDVVISNMALHYLADLAAMVNKIAGWTKPGGTFILTVEHPIFTAARETPLGIWQDDTTQTEWIVTRYFALGPRQGPFGRHYHHTFQEYITTLLSAGFVLQALVEPQPSAEALRLNPNLMQDIHRPVFLGFRCLRVPEQ